MKQSLFELWDSFYNSPFFIGGVGAIAGVLIPSEKMPLLKRLAYLFIGSVVAGYFSPLVIYWFGLESQEVKNAVVFLIGFTGMWVAGGIMKYAKQFYDDPKGFIQAIRKWRRR